MLTKPTIINSKLLSMHMLTLILGVNCWLYVIYRKEAVGKMRKFYRLNSLDYRLNSLDYPLREALLTATLMFNR